MRKGHWDVSRSLFGERFLCELLLSICHLPLSSLSAHYMLVVSWVLQPHCNHELTSTWTTRWDDKDDLESGWQCEFSAKERPQPGTVYLWTPFYLRRANLHLFKSQQSEFLWFVKECTHWCSAECQQPKDPSLSLKWMLKIKFIKYTPQFNSVLRLLTIEESGMLRVRT